MKEQEKAPSSNDKKTLGRRQLLMTVAAAGGAAAAFKLLPERWTKPVVEMVELPVHAQVSPNQILLTDLNILIAPDKIRIKWGADFSYEDGQGQVDDSASLYSWITPCGEILYSGDTISGIGATRLGTNSSGNISMPFTFNCTNYTTLHIVLGVGTRNSNELTGNFPS